MVEATTDLIHFDLSDDYPPDLTLAQLGFQERFMFARQEENSFFSMFGVAHMGIYKRLGRSTAGAPALAELENYGKKHSNMKEAVAAILRICRSFNTENPKNPFDDFTLIPTLKKYQAVCKSALGAETIWTDELLVDTVSQLFQVQTLLFIHTDDGLAGTAGLLDASFPVVHIEKVNEMYSVIIPNSTEEHLHFAEARTLHRSFQNILKSRLPRVPSGRKIALGGTDQAEKQKRSLTPDPVSFAGRANVTMKPLSETETDTFKQKMEYMTEKERNLRSLVEIQSSLLRALLPVVETAEAALLSAGFAQTLQSAGQLSSYLDVDPSVFTDMLSALRKAPNAGITVHSPEYCARYTTALVGLRCGHMLCKEHIMELDNHCPFGCF
jgi:hypothetical protein